METSQIYLQFHEGLKGFISRRVENPATAEDILQEVFLRIHTKAHTIESEERLPGWVHRVARNAITDHYRRRARQPRPLPELVSDTGEPGLQATEHSWITTRETDAGQARGELVSCLAPMLSCLPDSYREAMELVELQGLTRREAADRLGLSESGMKSRVQRGRRKLKEMLLHCCHVQLDSRNAAIGYQPRAEGCPDCRNGCGQDCG